MAIERRRVFIDTNVLLYAINPRAEEHTVALSALAELWRSGTDLVISTQVLNEFLAASSGKIREIGRDRAVEVAQQLTRICTVLDLDRAAFENLILLTRNAPIEGYRIYDASIVGTMLANDVNELLTNNVRHFEGISSLIKIVPLQSLTA